MSCCIVNITHISSLCYWLWLIKVSLQVILYKIETVMADSFEGLELLSQSFIESIFPQTFCFEGLGITDDLHRDFIDFVAITLTINLFWSKKCLINA